MAGYALQVSLAVVYTSMIAAIFLPFFTCMVLFILFFQEQGKSTAIFIGRYLDIPVLLIHNITGKI